MNYSAKTIHDRDVQTLVRLPNYLHCIKMQGLLKLMIYWRIPYFRRPLDQIASNLLLPSWKKKILNAFRLKMLFCFQNCSDLLIVLVIEKNFLKLLAKGREFSKFLRSLKTIYSKSKRLVQFFKQNAFLTCSWRFLISNKLEQL